MSMKEAPRPLDTGIRRGATSSDDTGLFPRPVTAADCERATREAERVLWMEQAQLAAWRLILDGYQFDAHTITEKVGSRYPGDGRRLAGIIQRHARNGHIERVDYRKNRRGTSGSVIAVWRATGTGRRLASVVLGVESDG